MFTFWDRLPWLKPECLKQDIAAAGVQATAAEDPAAWRAAINRLTSSWRDKQTLNGKVKKKVVSG